MSPTADRRQLILAYLAAAVAVTIWAAWIVWLRTSVAEGYGAPLAPVDVALLRFGAPALLLAPIWLRPGLREGFKPSSVSWPVLITMLGWGAPFVLLVGYGARETSVAHIGALVPGVMPLFAALFAMAAFRESLTASRMLGFLGIALAVILVIAPAAFGADGETLAGAPLLLIAAALWGAFAIAYRKSGLGSVRVVGIVSAYSVLALLPFAPVLGSRIPDLAIGDFLRLLMLHGVLTGVVSVVTYTYAIERLGAARAASFSALVPVLAALMGVVFLGEALGPLEIGAIVSASLGVALVNGAIRFGRAAPA